MNKEKTIDLVVIDQVSLDLETDGDIAKDAIDALKNSGVAEKIYQFESWKSKDYTLPRIADDIILAGGILGYRHLNVFKSILSQAREQGAAPVVHIPFDCTYYYQPKGDSGEYYDDGIIGKSQMPVVSEYTNYLQKNSPGAYVVEQNRVAVVRTPVFTLSKWDSWKEMAEFLRTGEAN